MREGKCRAVLCNPLPPPATSRHRPPSATDARHPTRKLTIHHKGAIVSIVPLCPLARPTSISTENEIHQDLKNHLRQGTVYEKSILYSGQGTMYRIASHTEHAATSRAVGMHRSQNCPTTRLNFVSRLTTTAQQVNTTLFPHKRPCSPLAVASLRRSYR